jgi:glycosyltransferase involved in cell wall biosynthesis
VLKGPIYIDITELAKNPICTGIQRVEREILQNWSGPNSLVPCIYHTKRDEFLEVTSSMLHSIMQYKGDVESSKTPFGNGITTARGIATTNVLSNLFNPEVFFDPIRSKKYIEWMSVKDTRISWLVYDFMPFLYPQHYPVGTPLHCMPYLRAMRNIPRLAFISNQTQCEFDAKIVRKYDRETIVFPLGGDGLSFEKQCFSTERRSFVYFGTIEPRKNVRTILCAFMILWERGEDIELFVIGRMDSRAQEEAALINQLQNEPRFHYLGHASDATICDVLRKARATIFVSSEEGFGIPPLESLAAGIPVIASNTLPSLNDLPEGGYLKIDTVSSAAICTAIEFLSADANASKLWQEASNLPIPTWRDFASGISNWLHAF